LSVVKCLEDVLHKVERHPLVKKLYVKDMHASLKRGYLRLMALFVDDSELHVFEYVDSDLRRLGYAYHYQNSFGAMIFRYDNEPHYPDLPTFPHHKHVAQEEAPRPSEQVNIDEVLREIASYIIKTTRK